MSNTHTPLARYIHYTYGTRLFFIRGSSQEGTQHGDSLGMLLRFSVAQPLVIYIQAIFLPVLNLWMADGGNFVVPIDVGQTITSKSGVKGLPGGSI